MKLNLPYPVSNNQNTRTYDGRVLTSKAAKAYKTEVGWLARQARCNLHTGDISVSILFHPKMNLDGSGNKNRLDLDNSLKVLLDSLNGIAWNDDKQITRIYAEVSTPIKDGGLTIVIEDCEQNVKAT